MNNRLARCVALLGLVAGTLWTTAQAPPLLRTPNTTNTSFGTPAANTVPTWDNVNNRWSYSLPPGATGGEANTASNPGATGLGVYASKAGVDLLFNSLAMGTGLNIASNANVLTITPTVQYQQTNANLTLLQAFGPTTWQATNANLTLWTAVAPTAKQDADADLTTWAGITPAANVGTFLATPSSANLATAVTGETGTGALVFGTAPEISAIELGHATDTTLERSGAGSVNIEGNAIYRAGGTDVPLADGGTGVSLVDPAANRLVGWDDTDNAIGFWTIGGNLSFDHATHTLSATGGTGATNIDYGSANLYTATNLLIGAAGATNVGTALAGKAPNTFAGITNALGIFTGGTTDYLRADGTMATPGGSGDVIADNTLTAGYVLVGNGTTHTVATNEVLLGGTNLVGAIAGKAPNTYAGITNALGVFTGATTTFLRADGTMATPAGIGVTNFNDLSANGMIVSNTLTVAGSLILTGTGGTELDSMQVTNKITNQVLTATRVVFAGADKALADDAGMTYVSGTDTLTVGAIMLATTNVAGAIADKQGLDSDLTAYAGMATNTILTTIGAQPLDADLTAYAGTGTNALLAAMGGAPLASPTFTGTVTAPTIAVATTTQGTVTMTNSPTYPLTTTWTATDATNYVADLTLPVMHFAMTTNMNFLHATNGTANFTANTMKSAQFILVNSSGTNWTNKFPTSWKRYGDVADSTFYVTNGDWCRMAIQFAGPSTDQTNVHVSVVYENN